MNTSFKDAYWDFTVLYRLRDICKAEIPNVHVYIANHHKGNKCIAIQEDLLFKAFSDSKFPFINKIAKRYGLIQDGEWDYNHKEYTYYLIVPKENVDSLKVLLDIQCN